MHSFGPLKEKNLAEASISLALVQVNSIASKYIPSTTDFGLISGLITFESLYLWTTLVKFNHLELCAPMQSSDRS